MTGILIATHHNLAGAFLETVEMIAGKHDFVARKTPKSSHFSQKNERILRTSI